MKVKAKSIDGEEYDFDPSDHNGSVRTIKKEEVSFVALDISKGSVHDKRNYAPIKNDKLK
jgi:hypothetical protein